MTDFRNNIFLLSSYIIIPLLLIPSSIYGQFIDIRLDIETESSVSTEQSVDFASFPVNSGKKHIALGDRTMGVLSISALENQQLLLSYNQPEGLKHKNPAIQSIIPFDLKINYGFSRDNYDNTKKISTSSSGIFIKENSGVGPWNNLYIFIYGSIDIGKIPGGLYSSNVILNIEYL